MSGVAKRCYDETGIQYLAGMWREGIERQLCWEITSPLKRPPWRAPSWSWASVNGRVHLNCHSASDIPGSKWKNKFYLHVEHAQTAFAHGDEFGAVTSGSLKIKCTALLLGKLLDDGSIKLQHDYKHSDELERLQFSWDAVDDREVEKRNTVYLLPVFSGPSLSLSMLPRCNRKGKGGTDKSETEDSDEEVEEQDGSKERYGLVNSKIFRGLLLRKKDGVQGQFRRLGLFLFWKHNVYERELYKPILSILKRYGAETAKAVCAEIIDNHDMPAEKYLIEII